VKAARILPVAVLIILLSVGGQSRSSVSLLRVLPYFSCSTFPPNETEADLIRRFGAENVKTALIDGGGAEGEMNPGTALFAGRVDERVEIFWKDKEAKRNPDWINIQGGTSRWRSPDGVTLGTDLLTLEKLNGRAFRLLGFGYDGESVVTSWAGGKVDAATARGCKLKVWLMPRASERNLATQKLESEVVGTREYSSGHPAMQRLNPRIYQLLLLYEQ
jgi:hypothetical protein